MREVWTQGECHVIGRRPWDNTGREWSDPLINQETPRTVYNYQKLGEVWNRFSFRASRKSQPFQYLDWTSDLQNTERVSFCCGRPPVLWYFVVASLGNSSTKVVVSRAKYYERKPPILGWRGGKDCIPKKGEGLHYQGKE